MKKPEPKDEQEKDYLRKLQMTSFVVVLRGRMSDKSTCSVKNCDRHERYLICIGGTSLSNLLHGSCSKHLSLNTDRAHKHAYEQVSKRFSEYQERRIKEAQSLIENRNAQ